ncbi:MAG: hypothetical protein ACRDWD_00015 [Acidimicrobiia bacterium]
MPALRTEITEIVTGLGMLGAPDVERAMASCPPELANVGDDVWQRLQEAAGSRVHRQEFAAAFANGAAFLHAREALRDRRPLVVEWRGPRRQPDEDAVPADLYVDHVYLVSCKYLSRILANASPAKLFDGAGATRSEDWYCDVAPVEYQQLYREVRLELGGGRDLPPHVVDLTPSHRSQLKRELAGATARGITSAAYGALIEAVSRASADRWRRALARKRDRERMLWRLLRMTAAPYFVLGTADERALRIRVETPWEWRLNHDLRRFDVWAGEAGQPLVHWQAVVRDRSTRTDAAVDGHVEIRWSHGRFAQPPEAKVYLDTPHHRVPGYVPLV